jgi:hypothetical protein
MKICTGCKEEKNLDEFGKDKKGLLGRNQKCKACCKARAKLTVHSQEAIEKRKKYRSEWQKKKRPLLNARLRERYVNNIETEREKAKERQKKYMASEKGRLKHNETKKLYEKKNPEKISAQRKVRNEIKRGRMIRPEICEICKKTGNIAAHHEDYNKPLEVIWMCEYCHLYHHQRSRFHAERLNEMASKDDVIV